MTELKTLKDINFTFTTKEDKIEVVCVSDLKAEAIKWIKFGGCEHQMKWIKTFFNLTDEDLK